MIDTTKKAWYPVAWKHGQDQCLILGNEGVIPSDRPTELRNSFWPQRESRAHSSKPDRTVQNLRLCRKGCTFWIGCMSLLWLSAHWKGLQKPPWFLLIWRCACGGKGEDKAHSTCGSWEEHSKNSEEGLPLAVVRQRVVEQKLFGVANEAVLCRHREGERKASDTTWMWQSHQACPCMATLPAFSGSLKWQMSTFFYWGEEINVVKWVQVPGKAVADGEHSGWCCSMWALLPHIEPCLQASRTPACETSPRRKTCCRGQLTSIFICPCRFNPSLPNGCLAWHMGMWPNTEQTPSQPALGCAPRQTSTKFFQGHTHTHTGFTS